MVAPETINIALVQRRATTAGGGGSGWADSPLAMAARDGGAVVLDGAHRLRPGVLISAVGRACAERELDLPSAGLSISQE